MESLLLGSCGRLCGWSNKLKFCKKVLQAAKTVLRMYGQEIAAYASLPRNDKRLGLVLPSCQSSSKVPAFLSLRGSEAYAAIS